MTIFRQWTGGGLEALIGGLVLLLAAGNAPAQSWKNFGQGNPTTTTTPATSGSPSVSGALATGGLTPATPAAGIGPTRHSPIHAQPLAQPTSAKAAPSTSAKTPTPSVPLIRPVGGSVMLVPVGFATAGTPHPPSFVTTLDMPPRQDGAAAARLQANAERAVARSSTLTQCTIRLTAEDQVIVLRGEVANERERRLAEGLVRLTPGVHQVRNELVIRPAAVPDLALPPP
jgi:hypothetical protein